MHQTVQSQTQACWEFNRNEDKSHKFSSPQTDTQADLLLLSLFIVALQDGLTGCQMLAFPGATLTKYMSDHIINLLM